MVGMSVIELQLSLRKKASLVKKIVNVRLDKEKKCLECHKQR
jgi:hypothetical protein